MTKKRQKRLILAPSKKIKPRVPENEKKIIEAQCNQLIETTLKSQYSVSI
jgi:hypothetical protein